MYSLFKLNPNKESVLNQRLSDLPQVSPFYFMRTVFLTKCGQLQFFLKIPQAEILRIIIKIMTIDKKLILFISTGISGNKDAKGAHKCTKRICKQICPITTTVSKNFPLQ